MFLSIRILLFIVPFFFVFNISSLAQTTVDNNYTVSFLTTHDGLSQATNRFMLQDSKGYMWISSQDGINRYDGNDFFHFTDPQYFKNCIPFKQAFGIEEDVVGDLWMGSANGLYRYSQTKNLFENFTIFSPKNEGEKTVIAFAALGNEIWVTDGKRKFASIDINTFKVKRLIEPSTKFPINYIQQILPVVDYKKRIWVVRDNLLYKFNPLDNSMQIFSLYFYNPKVISSFQISGLSIQQNEQVLGIATNKGLILFDINKEQQISISKQVKSFVSENIWHITADKHSFLVSTDSHRLLKITADGKSGFSLMAKKILDNETHRGSYTEGIYMDKWDRIWFNATGEYIAIIDFKESFMKKVARSGVNGLPSGTVISIANTDKSIWVSDTYLSEIDKVTGTIKKSFSSKDLPGSPSEEISQIFYDSLTNSIWLNIANKIYYYDLRKQKFFKLKYEFEGSTHLSDIARCFLRLTSGELLYVTQKGVYNISKVSGTAHLVKDFACENAIYHLAELPANKVAVSYNNGPIKIFRKNAGLSFSEIASIPVVEKNVMVLYHNGFIWAANVSGLYKIDEVSNKVIKKYTVKDGMANDCIYAVQADKYGWMWCSTNKGIIAINIATNEIKNYGLHHNLQDLEYNGRAFDKDKEGFIYFGGVKGLNYFKPPYKDKDTIPPKLIIESITLNNKNYASNINPDFLQSIQYKYGAVSLNIKALALHLVKYKQLKIMYRLNGIQEDWLEIKNGEPIRLFSLAPGKYTLEIACTGENSDIYYPIRVVHIEVIPPWNKTWWFYSIIGCLLAVGIILVVNYRNKQRIQRLKTENEIIKLKIEKDTDLRNERERIISDLHDDVGASLSSMYIFGDLAKSIWDTKPEESKKMIDKITITSKELMNRMGDIIWSMKPVDGENNTMEGRLKNYASELLAPKNIFADFDINENLANSITEPESKKNLLLIVKEAFNNTAKYSGATKVNISLTANKENIILTIQDNGKGFSMQTIQTGNGLKNIQSRCLLLGGGCMIHAEPDKGVKITCTFPIAISSYIGKWK